MSPTVAILSLPFLLISTILSALNFQTLSSIATTTTPTTIIAPTDSSLHTCPSCPFTNSSKNTPFPASTPSTSSNPSPSAPNSILSPPITASPSPAPTPPHILSSSMANKSRAPTSTHQATSLSTYSKATFPPLPSLLHVELMTTVFYSPFPPAVSNTPFFIRRLLLKDAVYRHRISDHHPLHPFLFDPPALTPNLSNIFVGVARELSVRAPIN